MFSDLKTLCVGAGQSIREAIAVLDLNRLGIVLVVTADMELKGTITDGDVRRALLANVPLEEPLQRLLDRKAGTLHAAPVTARQGSESSEHIELLRRHNIVHLPILDDSGKVVGLVTRDDFMAGSPLPVEAVIMAGGEGSRLLPLTQDLPKPMLPVGGRPLLEIIVGQLRDAGIRRVHITTRHKPEKIREHFGDGREFGVEMFYLSEDKPLGTAGGLALMNMSDTPSLLDTPNTLNKPADLKDDMSDDSPDKLPNRSNDTLLVFNGDLLTGIDIRRMLEFHREHRAEMTVAVRQYDIQLPYGIVECEGPWLRRLREKPLVQHYVNAGIYLLEPAVRRRIPSSGRFDMTDLIQQLLDSDSRVCSFPVIEYWLDIGQHEDYEKAQEQIKEVRQGRDS